ncbi:sulfite exporter TauE/SafE family protein [Salinimonas chungwhensis]|uniref:sulfite exporter TauE/SafE family protein n=1 Tax=Salinimonas chungwhensis TaxID=265425 RepID=UPI000368F16D|nr:sulfite exporter TauE/SafE family protein [Salinimonas chungwhensis]
MNELTALSAFLIGLAGGLHCLGMCGGIASALRLAVPADASHWPYTLSYNAGRIFSYTVAGAVAGGIGQMSSEYVPFTGPLLALLSGFMLLAMAAYLGRWWMGLTRLEHAGQVVWRRIQPLSKKFIPFSSPLASLPYGIIWGWLPCGLVYSTLTWALASGGAIEGAQVMLCFGLGTLPALIATSLGAHWLVTTLRQPAVRQSVAVLLALFAATLLYNGFRMLFMILN